MLNAHYTYFLILLGSIAGPLILSFDRKVAFVKKWYAVLLATFLPAILYILWDICFTRWGVWSFNPAYITGLNMVNLPIEEVLFFFVVPFCCTFIYECIRHYFSRLKDKEWIALFCRSLSGMLLLIALWNLDKKYTSYTGLLNAVFLFLLPSLQKKYAFIHLTRLFFAYLIILLPFMVVNGFLTAIPVVLYNDAENLGIRILTIPVEDIFYGMLLIFANLLIYEGILHYRRNK